MDGRRSSDPDDLLFHEDRRSIRALVVFASWLNHYDLRSGNTMDVIETKDGRSFVKHYLIDFGSTLGSAAFHAKVPVAGYEHVVDWREISKSSALLKFVEDPWEIKWDEAGRVVPTPALGYFDNRHFDPGEWTSQLPYEVFTRLNSGDAFWASKVIMSFSDEDIQTIVESGQFSSTKNTETLSQILIARRDIIAKYWFSRVTPLDQISLYHVEGDTYEIAFEDLAKKHGFGLTDGTYRYRIKPSGTAEEFSGTSFTLTASEFDGREAITIYLQAKNADGDAWTNPSLKIALAADQNGRLEVIEIDHGA